ncbi:MAG: hypothetical protein K9M45_08990 [Kiritimatiellales bacterium]|nr:hypothetical protein [Kiritimatiellales bacterium]
MQTHAKVPGSNLDHGLLVTHELTTEHIVKKLFGFIPLQKIPIKDIHYLRLATYQEVTPAYFMFNWFFFTPAGRSLCPVYVVYTRKSKRLVMKLRGGSHYKLRRAIAARKIAA